MLKQDLFLLKIFILTLAVCGAQVASAHRLGFSLETSNEDQSFGVSADSSVKTEDGGAWAFAGFFSKSQDRANSSLRSTAAGFDFEHEWQNGWQLGAGFQSARSEPSSAKTTNFIFLVGFAFYRDLQMDDQAQPEKFLEFQLRPQAVRYDYPGVSGAADESYLSRGSDFSFTWLFAESWKLFGNVAGYKIYDRAVGTSGGLFRRSAGTASSSTVLAIESESGLGMGWMINDIFDLEVSGKTYRTDSSNEVVKESNIRVAAQADPWDFALGFGSSQSDLEKINFTNFEIGHSW